MTPNLRINRWVVLAGGGFIPINLSAVVADFDSDSTGTTYITKDGSDNVSGWTDITGNRNVVQGTGSNQPNWIANQINGHPTIDFNGTSDFLREAIADYLIGSNTGTVFIVCINNGVNLMENFVTSGDESSGSNYASFGKATNPLNASIRLQMNDGVVSNVLYGDTGITDNTPHVLTYKCNGTSYGLRIDGVDQTVNVSSGGDTGEWFNDIANRDNLVFGSLLRSVQSFQGSRFARIIICDSILSDADEGLVESFLTSRYNL